MKCPGCYVPAAVKRSHLLGGGALDRSPHSKDRIVILILDGNIINNCFIPMVTIWWSLLINIEKWGKVDGFKTKRTDYQAPLYQGRSARRLFHYWYKFSTKSFLFQTFGYLQIWWEKRSFWSRDFLFWFWDLQLWCFGRRITYCGRKPRF